MDNLNKNDNSPISTKPFATAYADTNIPINGLSSDEVNERIANGQTNKVKNKVSKSYAKIFFDNFCTFFNLLCFICFFVLLVVARYKKIALSNFFFVILFVANSTIGVIQEIRAKHAVERLSLVKAPTAKVLRNGVFSEIAVSDLVLDDVVELSVGMQIPADCIVVQGSIEVNESLLTGESIPLKKNTGDDLLSGSYVVSGKCLVKLTKVGKDSYVQRLTEKAKVYKKTDSKLLYSLNKIIHFISILIIPVAIGSGIVNYYDASLSGDPNIPNVILSTCSVVIGLIPCGMFFLTTLSLAVGVIKLAAMNTHVQDRYSLEMLARVNVLCLDKTGTITDGNLKVKSIIPVGGLDETSVDKLILNMEIAVGDENQTATAIKEYLKDLSIQTVTPKYTLPFSSTRKYAMATFDGKTYVLGAPTFILKEIPKNIRDIIDVQMKIGCRVVLFGQSNVEAVNETLPDDVEPLAVVVLEDNIRPEAIETIRWFQQNDVSIRVISGDDPLTVSEIAKRAGILYADRYINLQGASDEEVIKAAKRYAVFGRVSPEQKALIITTLKDKNHTVGMTGDGVNDILAMKEADCSVTVASGSSAARNLAHLVLLDNNFNSLPQVVREGRRVINNIQRSAALYLMKTIFTFTFAVISIATLDHYPFTPGMMLMLEMLIIGLPSVALSIQPNSARIQGSFITHILFNAVPGAVVLIFNALVVKLVYNVAPLNLTFNVYQTLSAVALTLGGLTFLTVLCHPYDKFRRILVAFISTLVLTLCVILLTTTLLSGFFNLQPLLPVKDNLVVYGILVLIVVADYLILILTRLMFRKSFYA